MMHQWLTLSDRTVLAWWPGQYRTPPEIELSHQPSIGVEMANLSSYSEHHRDASVWCRRRERRLLDHDVEAKLELRCLLEEAVAAGFDVDGALFHQPNRGPKRVALARQAAMYLAHVCCGLSLTDVGTLFGRDRTTAAHACQVIELLREERAFDDAMCLLERVVRIVGWPWRSA